MGGYLSQDTERVVISACAVTAAVAGMLGVMAGYFLELAVSTAREWLDRRAWQRFERRHNQRGAAKV